MDATVTERRLVAAAPNSARISHQGGKSRRPSLLEALLDPVSVFDHPFDVLDQPWLSQDEKRAVLLSWARDELDVEQAAIKIDAQDRPRSRIRAVIRALMELDPAAGEEYLAMLSSLQQRYLDVPAGRSWSEGSSRRRPGDFPPWDQRLAVQSNPSAL